MTALQVSAQRELQRLIDRIENIESERKELASDVKDLFAEAKGKGYCVKTMRKILALRKKSDADRAEEQAILDVYLHALNMTDTKTPLGEYAAQQLETV